MKVGLFFISALFILLLLTSCSYANKSRGPHEVFYTQDGVMCFQGQRQQCGYTLWECNNGYEYQCATNIKE